MKNKLLYLLIFIVGGLASCDKDNSTDYIFDKSVNERFNELSAKHNEALQSPENGWIGYYNPNGETGAYSLLLKFNKDGSVIMHSDYEQGNANDTVTYSILKKQDIILTFESWTVLHAIYETNDNNNGGEYVFNISSATNDEIILVSKTDNSYDGDEVTTLILKPATSENWDLTDNYSSAVNIAGDATKSVFRNFSSDGTPIASFSYNESNRAAKLSYLVDGVLVNAISPIIIKPSGFSFIKPITIGGKLLDGFIYNADDDSYSDESGNVKLMYDMVPAVPLETYPLGKNKNGGRNNYFESGKFSLAFNNFYANYQEWTVTNHNTAITGFLLNDLLPTKEKPYFQINFKYGTGSYSAIYYFTYEIKEDGKVYFTFTESNGNAKFLDAAFQPLVQKFFNTKGHYIEATGKLPRYSNKTFSLINADDPSFKIDFYDF